MHVLRDFTLNIETELLEDQTARFTVEFDEARLTGAKKTAARKLARRVNIPGFRRGKAPYRILVQNGLEPQIEMDAIEELSQEIYRETLEQADIEPYGPGSFDDYKTEPAPTFIYTVPLQPTVELNEYRDVRRDYEAPEVTDEQVDEAMKRLQEQEALVEESSQPAVMGNRVTVDVHSEFADDAPEAEVEEGDDADDADDDAETAVEDESVIPAKGDQFVHQHEAPLTLDADDDPILKGFSEQLVGASAGDELEFELEVPEDDEDYTDIAGRKIKFEVGVSKIEVVTLPEMNDELAARITESEETPLTLLELRVRMRENLENEAERQEKAAYSNRVLDEMVVISDIAFPDAMVGDQIDAMLSDLESRLRSQGLEMSMYLSVTQQTEEDLREQYRPQAEEVIERTLVIRELVQAEKVAVTDETISERIEEMLEQFGDQAESIRPMFDTPNMRANLLNDMLQEKAMERVFEIGTGDAPDLDALEAEEEIVEAEESAEGDDQEVVAEESASEESSEVVETTAEVEETPDTESVDDVSEEDESQES